MPSTIKLSVDGRHFLVSCDHCQHVRTEAVNPAKNLTPFEFQKNCTACGQPLQPDLLFFHGVQQSFVRALLLAKKTAQGTLAMSGLSAGDKTGSAAYSALRNPSDSGFMKRSLEATSAVHPDAGRSTLNHAGDLASHLVGADKCRV